MRRGYVITVGFWWVAWLKGDVGGFWDSNGWCVDCVKPVESCFGKLELELGEGKGREGTGLYITFGRIGYSVFFC